MPTCNHCGREVGEVYYCKECGYNYCNLHIKPEDHDCNIIREYSQNSSVSTNLPANGVQGRGEGISSEMQEVIETNMTEKRGTIDGSYTWYKEESYIPENAFDPNSGVEFKGILFAHKSEITHFIVGALLIFLIGALGFYDQTLIDFGLGWAIFLLAGFYTSAFLFHELGHRQVARHYGLQTKFRLLTYGIALTLISLFLGIGSLFAIIPPLPTLALPGAVVVLGLEKIDKKTGLCKAAGPAVNLIYGFILLIISFIISKEFYPLNMFVGYAAAMNFILGSFNLIPLGILDGYNIFKWNKTYYFILISSLVILLVITLANVYAPIEFSNYYPK